jgi:YcaO-like protein with predicted kinase domain
VTRRLVPAEVTWERLVPLLPVLGITRVGMLTGLDVVGLPVATAVRPDSRAMIASQGKGRSSVEARVSATMEAVETWSAERATRDLKWGSPRALRGTVELTEPEDLPHVPGARPLGEDEATVWCEAREAGTDRPVWVPFPLVHTVYTPGGHLGAPRWLESTRGLAAGNDRTECLSHALCELLEGHANARVRVMADEEVSERRIDLDTVDDPLCRQTLDACARAGVDALVIDTTSELGLASFHAYLLDHEDQPWRVLAAVRGMGCHPSRGLALFRALSEAAQARCVSIAGSREDLPVSVYQGTQGDEMRRRIRELAKGAARPFQAVPTREHRTALEDAATALVAIQRHGCRALVVDCTVDPRLPVLRVLVPGLRAERHHL